MSWRKGGGSKCRRGIKTIMTMSLVEVTVVNAELAVVEDLLRDSRKMLQGLPSEFRVGGVFDFQALPWHIAAAGARSMMALP